jgi:polysaccharide biosynthesis/export protein
MATHRDGSRRVRTCMTKVAGTMIASLLLCPAWAPAQTSSGAVQMPLDPVRASAPPPQNPPQPSTAPSTPPVGDRQTATASSPTSDAEYHLGPGDLIEIGVFGVDELRQTVRLSSTGVIKIPLVEAIPARGLTPAELEDRIATLLANNVIKDPHVSVFVREYRSQRVYVSGAVKNPGEYQISLQMRIVDAVSLAGGLLPSAGEEATIQRPAADGGEETIRINIRQVIEKGDLSRNIVVRADDVVNIPERLAETVYVIGDVNRPGAFGKMPKQEWRVSQVLAYAGGPAKTAKLAEGILIRYDESGERKQLPLDLGQILRGKQPDFFVRADDVIFVPSSNMKTIGHGLLNVIPSMLVTLPYWIP